MRYAVLSDVHANLVALDRVLEDAAAQGAQAFVCLGDVVGYGPQPAEALARVRARCSIVLAGNHDDAVSGRLKDADASFIDLARDAVRRHREMLSRADRAWLRQLPYVVGFGGARAAHGDFTAPEAFCYVDKDRVAAANFRREKAQVLFVGHTHVPSVFLTGASGRIYWIQPSDFTLEEGKRYIVNPGSVGYPRTVDGVCRSSYVLYDDRERTVRYRTLPFAVSSVMERGRRFRLRGWRLAVAATAGGLALAGAVWAARSERPPQVVRIEVPVPVSVPTAVRAADAPVAERRLAVASGVRRVCANVKLDKGSAPAMLVVRVVGKGGVRELARTQVKGSHRKAIEVPDGVSEVQFALCSVGEGEAPRVRTFAPAAYVPRPRTRQEPKGEATR